MKLIMLSGPAGAGKDAVARALTATHPVLTGNAVRVFQCARKWDTTSLPVPQVPGVFDAYGIQVALADPLKEVVSLLYQPSPESLWGPSELRNQPIPGWGPLTPRRALQILGTEGGRAVHEDTWTRALDQRIKDVVYEQTRHVVVSDVRFPSEVTHLRAQGAELWFVQRGEAGQEDWRAHDSEQHLALLHAQADHVIDNSGTLRDLTDRVHQALYGLAKREPQYLVWEGTYSGDAMLWWREKAQGYTTDLDQAGRFTREQALRHTADPARRDRAFPEATILASTFVRRLVVQAPPDQESIAGRD